MLAAVKRFYMEVKLQSLCWPGELKDEGRSEASKFEKLAVRHTVIPSWRFVGWAVCVVWLLEKRSLRFTARYGNVV